MNLESIFDVHIKEQHYLKPLTSGDPLVARQYFTRIEKSPRCSQ